MQKINMVGQKYGRLTVVADAPSINGYTASWCRCDCGNPELVLVKNKYLRNGDTKSCGCYQKERLHDMRFVDLAGRVVGRLTVERAVGVANDGHTIWLCQCSCGKSLTVQSNQLANGKTRSCGCLRQESSRRTGLRTGPLNVCKAQERAKVANTTHNQTHTRLYRIWLLMRQRCRDANARAYGAKGISVTPEWQCFETFAKWARANGYADDLTIDRLNPDENYTPQNCRWISLSENSKRVRDGKQRYWCLDATNGFYAEFDNITRFVTQHPEFQIKRSQIYDALGGRRSTTIGQLEFGKTA